MGLDPVTLAAIAAAAKGAAAGAATSAAASAATGNKITPGSLAIGGVGGAAVGGLSNIAATPSAAITETATEAGQLAAKGAPTPAAASSTAATAARDSVASQRAAAAKTPATLTSATPKRIRTPLPSGSTRAPTVAGAPSAAETGVQAQTGREVGRIRGAVGKVAGAAKDNKLALGSALASGAAPLLLAGGQPSFQAPRVPDSGAISRGAARRREEERRRLRAGGRRATNLTRGKTLGRANIGVTSLLGG